jgi:hypothetical protein
VSLSLVAASISNKETSIAYNLLHKLQPNLGSRFFLWFGKVNPISQFIGIGKTAGVLDVDTAARNIKTFLSNFLPSLRISSFKCFGNSHSLTDKQRKGFVDNAISFVDVAGGKYGASDYIITSDMFSVAKNSQQLTILC